MTKTRLERNKWRSKFSRVRISVSSDYLGDKLGGSSRNGCLPIRSRSHGSQEKGPEIVRPSSKCPRIKDTRLVGCLYDAGRRRILVEAFDSEKSDRCSQQFSRVNPHGHDVTWGEDNQRRRPLDYHQSHVLSPARKKADNPKQPDRWNGDRTKDTWIGRIHLVQTEENLLVFL